MPDNVRSDSTERVYARDGKSNELRDRLIAAADADERAHRERAGLDWTGPMITTADGALSWLLAGLSVERAANRIANEEIAELRATIEAMRAAGGQS